MLRMAESRAGGGMRTPHRVYCWLLLLNVTAAIAMGKDTHSGSDRVPPLQQNPRPHHTGSEPHYDLRADVSEEPQRDFPDLSGPGQFRNRAYPPYQKEKETTTSLPRFLPDRPRPFVPDPSFLPGNSEIRVLQGTEAVLPCTVQYLGPRQISWQKLGTEHLISIGTEVWVKDRNLEVKHKPFPAEVSDWNLVFREARLEDSGLYECQVISTEKLTRRVRLSVVVITIEGKKFVEHGQTVYLRCNTTEGDSMPRRIDWFKDGDKIDGSLYPRVFITEYRFEKTRSLVSELMISSGTSQDSGTYICRSSSELIASVEVNVLLADTSNVKRGTGTSHTQVGSKQSEENAAMFFPSFLGNPLIIFLTLLSINAAQRLVT